MSQAAPPRKTAAASRGKSLSYIEVFRATPVTRIALIKSGVSARQVKLLSEHLRLDQKVMYRALCLKTATINRKASQDECLATDDSERVVGLAKLVGQVEAIVEDSGSTEAFDAATWLSHWLREPLPALGGAKPIDFLDTIEGQSLVSRALSQIQTGAYA